MLIVYAVLIFAFLGATQAFYGPLLPQLSLAFVLDPVDAGLLFAAHGSGQLSGVVLASLLPARLLERRVCMIAAVLVIGGFGATHFAGSWEAWLSCVALLACGYGFFVLRLNNMVMLVYAERSLAMLQFLNAAYSVGAILGPLLVGYSGLPFRAIYAGVALLSIALLPLGIMVERAAGVHRTTPPAVHQAPSTLAGPSNAWLLAGLVMLMLLCVGIEHSVVGWTATLCRSAGLSAAVAANFTSMFYVTLFAGRLLASIPAMALTAPTTMVASTALAATFMALAHWPVALPYAFGIAGLAVAPMFSAVFLWLHDAAPRLRSAGAWAIGAAIVGSAIFPPLVGGAIRYFGVAQAPTAILCVAAFACALALVMRRIAVRSVGRAEPAA